ncbi:hypothetical protein [Burkholderia alba]|uniref:hypothetical protein n=1 Tax=Burkholderia alba TaxID=2683677 RepID=UPI002B053534|nr:hypothetical protein [Burkholderia alba]
MKLLIRLAIAAALTVPICLGLARIDILARWVWSESTWNALLPLFRLLGIYGSEGGEDVLVTLLLILSFTIAFAVASGIVWIATRFIVRRHNKTA